MKGFLNNWFSFSRKELNGLFVLLLICIVTIVLRFYLPVFLHEPPSDFSSFKKEIRAFEDSKVNLEKKESVSFTSTTSLSKKNEMHTIALSPFNPNTLLFEDWLHLGFSEKQAAVIIHYLEKGGKFRKKEDLKKIYSITDAQYIHLEPFIVIENENNKTQALITAKTYKSPSKTTIELNTADSLQLISLKGIGPAFAHRILKFRERLGGFYAKEQLCEVYGLDSLVYLSIQNQLTVDTRKIKLTNINTATFNEFKRYPYWSNKQINAILNYKKKQGLFTSVYELKDFSLLDETTFKKVAPYLSID